MEGRTARIIQDLPTLTGKSFESLVRGLLTRVNSEGRLPFRFSRIGGYWNRTGDIEIDIVAFNEDSGDVLWGECKLNGNKFSAADALRLKEKAAKVPWRKGSRRDNYALFSAGDLSAGRKEALRRAGLIPLDLRDLLEG